MSRSRVVRRPFAWFAAAMVMSLAAPLSAAAAPRTDVVVIASGLNSPRGIDRQPGGAILVAEAGKGGGGPCASGPEGEVCFGRSGAITRVTSDGWAHFVDRLPSIAAPDGSAALGPHDVAKDDASIFATIGLGGDEAFRDTFGAGGKRLGTLVRWSKSRGVRVIADLLAYEETHDPDGDGPDSNPFGLLRLDEATIVTDAGGNSLLRVTDGGRISTIAVFPERMVEFGGEQVPMDAVPTSVVKGPDGAYYVGQLTGFPFPRHGARVFRVDRDGSVTVYARGFTNIIDIAFDNDGNLYVLEISHQGLLDAGPQTGALIEVDYDGDKHVLLKRGLVFPGGLELAADDDGAFVTNCGVCAGGGELWRVRL